MNDFELPLEMDIAKEKLLNKMRDEGMSDEQMKFLDDQFPKIAFITSSAVKALLSLLMDITKEVIEREGQAIANQVFGSTLVNFMGAVMKSVYNDKNLEGGDEIARLLKQTIEHEMKMKGEKGFYSMLGTEDEGKEIVDVQDLIVPENWEDGSLFNLSEEELNNILWEDGEDDKHNLEETGKTKLL